MNVRLREYVYEDNKTTVREYMSNAAGQLTEILAEQAVHVGAPTGHLMVFLDDLILENLCGMLRRDIPLRNGDMRSTISVYYRK